MSPMSSQWPKGGWLALVMVAGCATAPRTVEVPGLSDAGLPWTRTAPPPSLPSVPFVEPPAHEVTLPNGLRVVVIERHERPIVATRLLLRAGAAVESDERAGITWLSLAALEDRVELKTSDDELLVSDEKSARRQLADLGGRMDFEVTHDGSWIGVEGYSVDTLRYLEALRDVMKARRHGAGGFGDRREALLDAIEDLELGDDETLSEHLARLAFGARHVYARRVIGTMASLDHLGIEDLVAHQNAVLQPRGATLLVVGDVDHAKVLTQAASVFQKWTPTTGSVVEPPIEVPKVGKRQAVRVIPRTPARTTALCGVRGLGDVTESDAALDVFAETMGSDRLRSALREERGLTYGTQALVLRHRRARALIFCARLPTAQTTEGLVVFVHALEGLRASPPSDEEVERAKATLQSRFAVERSDVQGIVASWTRAVQLGKPTGVGEARQALAAVTTAELAKLSREVLAPERLQLVLTGETATIEEAVKAAGLGKSVTIRVAHE